MSDTQSQTAQSSALHTRVCSAFISANLVCWFAAEFEHRAASKPHRGRIYQAKIKVLEKSNSDSTTGPREICCLFLADCSERDHR